jgi:putative ABC transport system ATP-binding protein
MVRIEALRYAWPAGRGAARVDCLHIEQLHIARGETVFLHGPSGGGKSTLLGLLAGVLRPDSGSVQLLGEDWGRWPGARRDAFRADHVGYLFQQFNLLPYLSVLDNVLLPCRFSAQRAQRAAHADGTPRRQAESLLRRVGLDPTLWPRPAAQLSVGQQQRVAAARALIGAPELLIADEPTSALDAALREAFMALLLEACRAAASTLVFVSHDERLTARFDRTLALATLNRAPAANPDMAPAGADGACAAQRS